VDLLGVSGGPLLGGKKGGWTRAAPCQSFWPTWIEGVVGCRGGPITGASLPPDRIRDRAVMFSVFYTGAEDIPARLCTDRAKLEQGQGGAGFRGRKEGMLKKD